VLDPFGRHPTSCIQKSNQRSVNSEIVYLLEQGIVEDTSTPWAAPILVVFKQERNGRVVRDFLRLQNRKEPEPFPLPYYNDALVERADFWGHSLSLNTVQPQQEVDAILKLPASTTKLQVQSLSGIAGYSKKFLHHFSDLILPLTALLKRNVSVSWSEATTNAFINLKSRLAPDLYSVRLSVA